MKQKVLLNILKIVGASWCAFGVGALSVMILRFMKVAPRTEYIISSIAGGISTMLILYVMAFRDGYKTENKDFSICDDLVIAGLSALGHLVLCLIMKGDFCVSVSSRLMMAAWANMDSDKIGFFKVFCVSLLFDLMYAISIFLGSFMGRKRRANDRKMLIRNTSEKVK